MTRLHDDQIPVDEPLARRLVEQQFPDWSDLPIRMVDSGGTDNAVLRLGDDLALRLPIRPGAATTLTKEHRWLPVVAPHLPIAVPQPVARGVPADGMPFEWSIYGWIPGRVATPAWLGSPAAVAETVGRFVAAIHAIDPTDGPPPGPHNGHRGVPLAHRDAATRAAIDRLADEADIDALLTAWETALAAPVWDRPGVWIHGDLWETNLLLDDAGDLAAIIDFGCLGVGDPATDLTVAWNLFDAPTRQVFREHAAVDDATWDRGRGWALSFAVIALPYYLDTNPVIVENARRMIQAVLED